MKSIGIHSIRSSPVDSLKNGNWVKLICGASFEVIKISNLGILALLCVLVKLPERLGLVCF